MATAAAVAVADTATIIEEAGSPARRSGDKLIRGVPGPVRDDDLHHRLIWKGTRHAGAAPFGMISLSRIEMNAPASSADVRERRLEQIRRVVDERVRPELQGEGGDVDVVSIDEDGIVQIRLLGACQGCGSSVHVTTMFVEQIVKAEVPEVRFLEAIP